MKTEYEINPELLVWSISEQDALRFVGKTKDNASIRVVKEHPETAQEVAKYKSDAKLFAIRM